MCREQVQTLHAMYMSLCVCVCVCVVCVPSLDRFNFCHGVCMCASVCIEDQSNGDKHDVCTSYGTCSYMHMYLCAVKGGSTENQSRGNSTCMKSCQRNTVSFTQCVHMHK